MNDHAFEHYDKHYHRAMAYRDGKILTVDELARDRAPRWLSRIPKDAHILDYGCADGYMLWVLHTLGYRNLVGADISESVLRLARTRLANTSVELRNLTANALNEYVERFDVIIMHQVLEHIPREDVIPTLTHLRGLLKVDGLISIAVPNASAIGATFNHARDFTHQVLYEEISLRQVLELSGLTEMEVVLHPPTLYFHPRRPTRMLARLSNRLRHHLNNAFHRAIYALGDHYPPRPSCFEYSVEVVAYRRSSTQISQTDALEPQLDT
jgi:2-polyprenyl-3-methyl-5-hydroxy-6-metoxy-1,4-benzoquinol methylase